MEQIVDIPVPHRGGSQSLQGFSPGHGSGRRSMEQNVDVPVPGPRPSRGFPPRQGSQRTAEQIIDIPVSRTLVEVFLVFTFNRVPQLVVGLMPG